MSQKLFMHYNVAKIIYTLLMLGKTIYALKCPKNYLMIYALECRENNLRTFNVAKTIYALKCHENNLRTPEAILAYQNYCGGQKGFSGGM